MGPPFTGSTPRATNAPADGPNALARYGFDHSNSYSWA
jgi:hypothetical protein